MATDMLESRPRALKTRIISENKKKLEPNNGPIELGPRAR